MPSRPLVVSPDLAVAIGLNEAIALQQLHYWLNETTSGVEYDNVRWIYNTHEEWEKQFPFWSLSTIKRTFSALEKLGLIRSEQLNKSQRDMTNYYTINYGHPALSHEVKLTPSKSSDCTSPVAQNEPVQKVKKKRSTGSKRAAVIGSNWTDDHTEITTENTAEKISCQPPEATDAEVLITEQAKQVLTHLNQITGSRYQMATGTLQNIRARLAEGFTTDELVLVADYTTAKWAGDLKMADYLRPSTLYQLSKFPGYLSAAGKWAAAGRPECVNGKWISAATSNPPPHWNSEEGWRDVL
ncbi:hypothetical protein SOASR031_06830 [Leminorella grimontii]|nr:hypothetical protein SOASR031_06830 [Leminorella grimontii]